MHVNKNGAFLSALDRFADVDAHGVKAIIAAGSDIALLITADGVVQDVYVGPEAPPANDIQSWSGHGIYDLVTEESREKISDMLERARSDEAPRWREINHRTPGAEDFPVRYAAISTGEGGKVILLGRDLHMVAQLQQRLVQAQLTMEQDYERIRQIETRYRVLFETTHEALLIVSSETGRILDANSAAARLFAREVQELTNRVFANRFDTTSQQQLAAALAQVRETGRERSLDLRSRGDNAQLGLDVLLFRSVNETLFLCRLTPRGARAVEEAGLDRSLTALYRQANDAIVFTDAGGAIKWANTAFLGLADVAVSETVRGASFGEFLGRPAVDLNVMMTNARAKGRLSVYSTSFRSAFGVSIPVEISTTYLADAKPEAYGFVLRDVSRAAALRGGPTVSSDSVEHIIDLVGSTPLKELVRGTTDVVEKLCIETAIRLTNNNRTSAAEMLGLSRQSLYVKLRKYGLIDQEE
ncbi:MAG: transcriptional regulator PpsR [Rhodobacteraceae bacterium]|nr:transcriptional regulator PpsR [Paracoccaceae bacterium]